MWLCDKLVKGKILVNFMSRYGVLIDYHPLTIELVQTNELRTHQVFYGTSSNKSVSNFIHNLWTETEIRFLTVSLVCFWKGSYRPPESNRTLEKLSKFLKSTKIHLLFTLDFSSDNNFSQNLFHSGFIMLQFNIKLSSDSPLIMDRWCHWFNLTREHPLLSLHCVDDVSEFRF